MTRDYAKKSSHRSQNRPNARKSRPTKQSAPGWLWLLAGILVGVLFTVLFQLSKTPDTVTASAPEESLAQEESGSKPRFDFYTLLRESEFIVPDSPPPQTDSEQVATPPQVSANEVFLLQVGSFKASSDADSLRARLLLLNLSASIEKVSPRKGENWHRVLVGPFTNHSDVSAARNRLSSNGIDSLLLKRKQ
ncbi:SPOR domain-containing protein [Porticoccus sp.]